MDKLHRENQREERIKMVEIILAGLIGVLLGVGGAKALENKKPTIEDTTATQQQEVIKQLTDLDVIKEICAPEVITNEESRLLCREMTCLVYSRGIDSQTSGSSCEEISNIANTISMVNYCRDNSSEGSLCYEIFWRRK